MKTLNHPFSDCLSYTKLLVHFGVINAPLCIIIVIVAYGTSGD